MLPVSGMSDRYVPERRHNPLVRSLAGGRVLSALMLPWFTVLPPAGFGVVTTTGRRTGKARRKCIRAVRNGDKAYVVAIPGARAAWLKNIRANPSVRLRIRGGAFSGTARELSATEEVQDAIAVFCGRVFPLDYAECVMHRPGRPARSKIVELLRGWFDTGIPLVIELRQ
jgi:deazaflavin-dependent oxidoreductase (nitroreductase family)